MVNSPGMPYGENTTKYNSDLTVSSWFLQKKKNPKTEMFASFMHPLGNCHIEVKYIYKEKLTYPIEGTLGS